MACGAINGVIAAIGTIIATSRSRNTITSPFLRDSALGNGELVAWCFIVSPASVLLGVLSDFALSIFAFTRASAPFVRLYRPVTSLAARPLRCSHTAPQPEVVSAFRAETAVAARAVSARQ